MKRKTPPIGKDQPSAKALLIDGWQSSSPTKVPVPLSPIRFYAPGAEYGELSNMWLLERPLILFDLVCASSEHAFHASKYIYPGASAETLAFSRVIANASTPYKSKLLANRNPGNRYKWMLELQSTIRRYPNAVRDPNWDGRRIMVMRDVLIQKYRQDRHCRKVLLSTRGRYLEETGPKNNDFWGIGNGSGMNWLGVLSMEVRQMLLEEREHDAID